MKPDKSGTSLDMPSDPPPPKQEEPPEVPLPDSIPVDEPNVDPQQPPKAAAQGPAGSHRGLMASPSPAPTDANHSEPPAPSRAPSRASANTKAFWSLMEQWGVPDAAALETIGFSGKLGKSGKRPRFRLNTQQVHLLEYLQELGRAAEMAHGSASAWLNHRQRTAPMNGRTPIQAIMQDGPMVIPTLLRNLNRMAMRKALELSGPVGRKTTKR